MDKDFFPFDHHQWQTLTTSMEIQSSDQFDSVFSSMVNSPVSSSISNDNFLIRELIGKLGNICNSGDIPTLPPYIGGGSGGVSGSTNNSCYSTPINSPPKINLPIIDPLVKEKFPSLGNSIGLSSNLPAMPGDPGFAERAARFSSFGSRSFNGRTTQLGGNQNVEFGYRLNNNSNSNSNSSNLGGSGKLQRVCSSPLLKIVGSQVEKNGSFEKDSNGRKIALYNESNRVELVNSRENSSVSGQNQVGESGVSRKRKASSKGKVKETQTQIVVENAEDSSCKRSKSEENNGFEEAKTEENRGDEGKKQSNSSQKPPEPPKDYIHVRARRGQATDSHSLAERVRREKISERMKLLQDLVPGCNKVTGKALMLDEIINYVQSLQRQVEFLSMKLASVNPRLEFNVDNLFSKDVIQSTCSLSHPMYPLESLAPTLYGQPHQNHLQNTSTGLLTMAPFSMEPLNQNSNQNHALQLPPNPIDGFANGIPRLSTLCEGDLQSIVEMGYNQKEKEYETQHMQGPNQTSLMKIEF